MATPHLPFLWHMHQPYYRNIISGDCIQPWVRLHGIHSYYDMMRLYEENPDINANINFVPSLLRQLKEYVEDGLTDKFMELSIIDAKELEPAHKIFILRNFFMANPTTMIQKHPRYWKLFQQRGTNLASVDLNDAIRYFSWKDYLDIQVFYNLVWFGFKAREDYPEVGRMLQNPSSAHIFSEDDKRFVLKTQIEVLKRLFEMIKNAPKNIELTTTPYFHPILPLLIDTDIAKRSMPKTSLPHKFSSPKHAEFQIQHGLTYFEQTVGRSPVGFWPSEGSVCPELIPMLEQAGIKWFATDEGILQLSGAHGKRAEYLYQPYRVEHDGKSVSAIFRDRELSDLVSFSYAKMTPNDAVEDFTGRIATIGKNAHSDNPLITVLLDGENPWESYENSGGNFLKALTESLRKNRIRTTTVSHYLSEHPPKNKITRLHSGSWINSNYAIWIGKPQKNKAWDYIKTTSDELGPKLSGVLDNAGRSENELKALESFGAACGSDWFWWFDDDFESEFKSDFDKIFRMHLKNTFTLLGRDIPVFLYEPIFKYVEEPEHEHGILTPKSFIYPNIDGLNTSFFEWANSVKINVGRSRGPMGQSDELLECIYFGFNEEAFFMKFDTLRKDMTFSLKDDEELVVYLHDKTSKYKLRLHFDGGRYQMNFVNSPDEGYSNGSHSVKWALRSIFEFELGFKDLGYHPGEQITIIVTVVRRGIEVRHYSHLQFVVPDETYEKQMWSV